MKDEPVSSARSAIILAAVVSVVALYIVFSGMQTLAWIDAKRMTSQNPWLTDTPQPLAAAGPSARPASTGAKSAPPKTTELKAYDFEFTVPWSGKFKQTPALIDSEFRFDSGQVVVFFDPDAQADIVRTIRNDTSRSFTAFQPLLGEDAISSNYGLYQTVYATSPAQISLRMAATDAQRLRTLLLTKLSFGFDLEKKISSFDFGENKGMQFGDPATREPVALRVFNSRDKQFRFIFTVREGSAAEITQDDINQTVQSLEPVPLLER